MSGLPTGIEVHRLGVVGRNLREKPSKREDLRKRTRSLHERTECSWGVRPGGFRTLDCYRAFLNALLCVHAQLGLPAARERNDVAVEKEELLRIQALSADLGTFPIMPTARSMTRDYAWGVSYALNGSALGAAAILRFPSFQASWPMAYLMMAQQYVKSGRLGAFFRSMENGIVDIDAAASGADDVFHALIDIRTGSAASSEF